MTVIGVLFQVGVYHEKFYYNDWNYYKKNYRYNDWNYHSRAKLKVHTCNMYVAT